MTDYTQRLREFGQLNPDVVGLPTDDTERRRYLQVRKRALALGGRVVTAEGHENHGGQAWNAMTVRNRARSAQAEHDRQEAFARLNPDFGVLPDDRDPAQHRFAQQRERALALGERVAAAELSSRERGQPSDLFSFPPMHIPPPPERATSPREHTRQPTADCSTAGRIRHQPIREGAER
jgi:hypothetical protein